MGVLYLLSLLTIVITVSIKGTSCQIYSKLPSYRGYDLTCTACQGFEGGICDVTPEKVEHTVQCRGPCLTWRTLYNTGREMRKIYRGCSDNLFPNHLAEAAKNGCTYDNFFVECSTLCEDGHRCNDVGTGIPPCWNCKAEFQPCDIEPSPNCSKAVIKPRIPWEIDCVSCVGKEDSLCDSSPEKITQTTRCNDTCLSWRTIASSNRSTTSIWRGCKDTQFPDKLNIEALDSCDFTNKDFIECTVQCHSPLCNKYSKGISNNCWTEKAELKDQCKKHKQISINPYLNQLWESYIRDANDTNSSSSSFYGVKPKPRKIKWWQTTESSATTISDLRTFNLLCAISAIFALFI